MRQKISQDTAPEERMKSYIERIAAGPRLSKDLSEEEAEDALEMILNSSVSDIRSAVFLIAQRMKHETQDENMGAWKALAKTAPKCHTLPFDRLLQIADAFDGVVRVPYFGFYTIPLMAELGLPTYGLSAQSLPPKFGVTFEDLLVGHYACPSVEAGDRSRISALEKFKWGYLPLSLAHPALNRLAPLRSELVKRTLLSTLEKLLQPLRVQAGGNYLASSYFHKGYEESMLAVSKLGGFDRVVFGNGHEGTTLYGVHKPAKIFRRKDTSEPEEIGIACEKIFSAEIAENIHTAFATMKDTATTAENIARMGEQALREGSGPAAPLIASQTATLCVLFEQCEDHISAYQQALAVMKEGRVHQSLMSYLKFIKNG
jgi:anthranilate phosphoribosyltransferase